MRLCPAGPSPAGRPLEARARLQQPSPLDLAPPTQTSGLHVRVAGESRPPGRILARVHSALMALGCARPFPPHSPSSSLLSFSTEAEMTWGWKLGPCPFRRGLKGQRWPCSEGQRQLCRFLFEPFPFLQPLLCPFSHLCHTLFRAELLAGPWRPWGLLAFSEMQPLPRTG